MRKVCLMQKPRVDFYEVDGKAYFGELTFYQNSGLVPIEPPEWDKKLGSWIKLPDIYGGVCTNT